MADEPGVERRLAAILAADVVGYSRLMEADEAGTHARLKALRKELIEPRVAEHRGRVVKLTGDGALVEFASVVDAVLCAVEVQRSIAEHNADVAPDTAHRVPGRHQPRRRDHRGRRHLRRGRQHRGAARGPGATAVAHVCNHRNVGLAFEPMGEHRVKNIAGSISRLRGPRRAAGQEHRAAGARVAVDRRVVRSATGLPYERVAEATVPPLPDKPSIAVLPFANLSGDPKEERLADGITEDIITDLSRFRDLFVIARNSTFVYKDKPTDVRQIARELGVQYVLEGSLQAQDGTRTHHGAAGRCDDRQPPLVGALRSPLDDVFAIQDEVTETDCGNAGLVLGPGGASAAGTCAAQAAREPPGVRAVSARRRGQASAHERRHDQGCGATEQSDCARPGFCPSLRRPGVVSPQWRDQRLER